MTPQERETFIIKEIAEAISDAQCESFSVTPITLAERALSALEEIVGPEIERLICEGWPSDEVRDAVKYGLTRMNAIERYAYSDEPALFTINYPKDSND